MTTLMDERCVGEAPRFTAEEEADLHRRYMAGEEEAATLLTRSILPWAYQVAKKISTGRGWAADEMELHSAINLGVTEALNNFKPELGRLTTYVFWRVKAVCGRSSQFTQLIKTPSDIPYRPESMLGVESEYLQKAKAARKIAWLSSPLGDETKGSVGDLLYDKKSVDPRAEFDFRQQRLQLRWALVRLPAEDAEAIRLTIIEGLTLEDAGDRLGVTRERIRQRQSRALEQLAKYMRLAPSNEEDLVDLQGNPLQLDGVLGPGRDVWSEDSFEEQGAPPVSYDFDEDVADVEEPTECETEAKAQASCAPVELLPRLAARPVVTSPPVVAAPPMPGPGLTDEACHISAMLANVSINDIDRELDLLDGYYQRFINEYQRKKQLLSGMRNLLTGVALPLPATPAPVQPPVAKAPPAAAPPAAAPPARAMACDDEDEDEFEDYESSLRPRQTNAERSEKCRRRQLCKRPRPNTMSATLHSVLTQHGSMSVSRAASLAGTNYTHAYSTLHRFLGRFFKKQNSNWAAMTEMEMEEKWDKIKGNELALT